MFISFCLLDPKGFDPEDAVLLFYNLNPEGYDPEGYNPEALVVWFCLRDPEGLDPEELVVWLCVCFVARFYFVTC